MSNEQHADPAEQGSKEPEAVPCLRCEAIRAGKLDDSIPDHPKSCPWRAMGRDPTIAELVNGDVS